MDLGRRSVYVQTTYPGLLLISLLVSLLFPSVLLTFWLGCKLLDLCWIRLCGTRGSDKEQIVLVAPTAPAPTTAPTSGPSYVSSTSLTALQSAPTSTPTTAHASSVFSTSLTALQSAQTTALSFAVPAAVPPVFIPSTAHTPAPTTTAPSTALPSSLSSAPGSAPSSAPGPAPSTSLPPAPSPVVRPVHESSAQPPMSPAPPLTGDKTSDRSPEEEDQLWRRARQAYLRGQTLELKAADMEQLTQEELLLPWVTGATSRLPRTLTTDRDLKDRMTAVRKNKKRKKRLSLQKALGVRYQELAEDAYQQSTSYIAELYDSLDYTREMGAITEEAKEKQEEMKVKLEERKQYVKKHINSEKSKGFREQYYSLDILTDEEEDTCFQSGPQTL